MQSPTRSFFFAAEIACREVYFFANWYGSEGRPLLFDMLTFIYFLKAVTLKWGVTVCIMRLNSENGRPK
jgi:hypothetical protein